MLFRSSLLVAVALCGACSDDGDPPAGGDAAVEAGPAAHDAGRDAATDAGEHDASADAALPECEPACEGATPLCDRGQLLCVECLGDEDCDDPTPRCVPGAGTCVLCLEASDCTADPARPACLFVTHECVGCRDERDCSALSETPRCEPATHTCEPCAPGGDECASVGTCLTDGVTTGDDELVATHAGGCVPCNEDVDCEAEEACDPWSHECVLARGNVGWCEECFTETDCPAGDACVALHWPGVDGPVVGTVCAQRCANPGGYGYADGDALCVGEVGEGTVCVATEGRDGRAEQACLPAGTTCDGFAAAPPPPFEP